MAFTKSDNNASEPKMVDDDHITQQTDPDMEHQSIEKDTAQEIDPFCGEDRGIDLQVKYKTMNWWHCGVLMIAESVSLGALSLPSSMAAIGIVPTVILILGLGALTTYTGWLLGQFKMRHPSIHSMADAGYIIFLDHGDARLSALRRSSSLSSLWAPTH